MPKKTTAEHKKNVTKDVPDASFEKSLERLETIVTQLESAEAPLEKALALYEEGVTLARFCSEQLKTAERKVELLEDKNNELRGRPFAHEAETYAKKSGLEKEGGTYAEKKNDDEEESEDDDEESGSFSEDENDEKEQERLF